MEIGDITINQDVIQRSLDALRKTYEIFQLQDEANSLRVNKKDPEYLPFTKELKKLIEELQEKFQDAVFKHENNTESIQ